MYQLTTKAQGDHLANFNTFLKQLANKFEPIQILIFYRQYSSSLIGGAFIEEKLSVTCDYCLLLVTETVTRVDYEVQDFVNAHYRNGTVTVICHDKNSIQEAINKDNSFFSTVYKTENLIYNRDGMSYINAEPSFDGKRSAEKALKHYQHRIPLAEGFLLAAKEVLQKGRFDICLFMLHQAVEQTCIGISQLKTFTTTLPLFFRSTLCLVFR